MRIVKASAGSGKTYTLANSYIDLLLASRDRYAYRHILAVTFTNKATAEMKSRILRDLRDRAKTDPRAHDILVDLLHDYSAFAVSTIDKFFQQALRAFSREIGQFASYQIELDRDSLVTESMDRMLDSLTPDKKELVEWLRRSVMDKIEQGRRFNIEEGLYEIGSRLGSEEYRRARQDCGIPEDEAFSKERLSRVASACRKVIADFHARVKAEAEKVAPTIVKPKARGYLQPYLDGFKPWEAVPEPKKTLSKECPDSMFMDLFGEPYKVYNTARRIDSLTFSLGVAAEFQNEFKALLKEKNVMPLDDSNTILRDIIDGSDAPFVYEKLGVRFENFLLDEFQDTSGIQWDNFLPLLREAESSGGECLVVGDVKQSIYRWRDSDWNLLGSKVGEEFPLARTEVLDFNWRSLPTVVDFNNRFFAYAAGKLELSDIYSDVQQKPKTDDPQPGMVRATFTGDQMDAVLESVQDARQAGAQWGDIAVLVRGRREGASIAAHLISHEVPVISDDSLSLKSSLVVRRLVSLLSSVENPGDAVGSYLARSMDITFPEKFHSLTDLCESLLRSLKVYDPESFEGDTLFIQAFMDDLQSWVEVNGNNLRYYLKHWDESDPLIGSPENTASVRILTIHKSKGLEFPYVIFPFADKVGLYKEDVRWCPLDASGTALGECVNGIYPVSLSESAGNTLFEGSYAEERRMQAVDNINVFYVALTRAVKCLHIIAKEPSKKFKESLDRDVPEFTDLSQILYAFLGKATDCTEGQMYDFSRMKRDNGPSVLEWPASYESYEIGDRLTASQDSFDFFSPDGKVGSAASARLDGIALHSILSKVNTPEDVRGEVDWAVENGHLSPDAGEDAFTLLYGAVSEHPEWFGPGVRALNELSIIDTDGGEYRPDRVVIAPDGGVTVIDYKFGAPESKYERQVARYMSLYRRMGHEKVSGLLWYVRAGRTKTVTEQEIF